MKYFHKIIKYHQDGFTLVEIILSLVISGILAAMIATYLGNSIDRENFMDRAVTPANNLRDTLNIYTVMEHMRLHYSNTDLGDPTLAEFKVLIGNAGTTVTNGKPVFGGITYQVLYNGYVKCEDPATDQTFYANDCSTVPCNSLLVSIGDPDQPGIKASNLFTK